MSDDPVRAQSRQLQAVVLDALRGGVEDLAATVIERVPPTTTNPLERQMIEAAHKLSRLARLLATAQRLTVLPD